MDVIYRDGWDIPQQPAYATLYRKCVSDAYPESCNDWNPDGGGYPYTCETFSKSFVDIPLSNDPNKNHSDIWTPLNRAEIGGNQWAREEDHVAWFYPNSTWRNVVEKGKQNDIYEDSLVQTFVLEPHEYEKYYNLYLQLNPDAYGGDTRGKIKVFMFELIAYAIGSDGRRRRLDNISQPQVNSHGWDAWRTRCGNVDDCGVFIGYPGTSSIQEEFHVDNETQGLQGGLNRKNYTPWNWIAMISDRRTMPPV